MSIEKSWPDGTFVWEDDDQEHYCGSHWDPFFDKPDEMFGMLPEIVPASVPLTTFGDIYSGPHDIPEDWVTGGHLCWPNANQGLVATLCATEDAAELMNISPFAGVGVQVGIEIDKVHVWTSGAEAQVEGAWGEAAVSFFDLAFLHNRSWYETGKRCEFIVAGIAYEAGPARVDKLALAPESRLADWQRASGGLSEEEAAFVSLEGSRIFLPVTDWDRDDYRFRGPVRDVTAFDQWLGQSGWRLRVGVMEFEGENADLDVFVTERAWHGDEPPRIGQDIDGRLWLQGRLWSAVRNHSS